MKRIAVIFPGIGYHCDKPLLYFGRAAAKECGYGECVNLSYSFDGGNIRGNEEKMEEAFRVLYAQAEEVLNSVNFSEYDDILFISKSVGTIIASAYTKRHNINSKNVLYTPLKQTYLFEPKNAAAFIGTGDPWSKVSEVVQLSERMNIPIHIYENANHSLEVSDVRDNLKILGDVMEKTEKFLAD